MKNIAQGLPLKKYKGNKHKDGGIMVNALGNKTKDVNKAVAEVEGGEYNFRYNPNNPKDNYILSEQLGIAGMAKQADRFKGNNRIDYNTRTNLLNKSMKLNEMLRVQQEQQPMQMALGGGLKDVNPFDKQPPKQKDSNFRKTYQSTPMNVAKMFDPTGISSYPDVAYSIDDYNKGKGSKSDIALNVLGALPIIGKAKGLITLAKGTSKTKKGLNTITKLGDLAGDIERFPLQTAKDLTNSATKPVAKMVNKSATNLLNFNDVIRNKIVPPLNSNQFSTKSATKSDMINAGTSLVNIGNLGSDINSVSKKQFGGKLKKYGGGGFNDSGPIDDNIQNYYKNTTTRDVVSTPGNELTNVPMQPVAPLVRPKLDVSKEMQQAQVAGDNPVKQKKNNFKGALSAVSGAVSALGPIGQGVGTAMQLAPYAIDLGKAMFDKTSVQDLQTQGSAMRLPNTTYAKNGGKLNVVPLPKFEDGGTPKTRTPKSFKNIGEFSDSLSEEQMKLIKNDPEQFNKDMLTWNKTKAIPVTTPTTTPTVVSAVQPSLTQTKPLKIKTKLEIDKKSLAGDNSYLDKKFTTPSYIDYAQEKTDEISRTNAGENKMYRALSKFFNTPRDYRPNSMAASIARFEKDNLEREKEYDALVGNALSKFNSKGVTTPTTTQTTENTEVPQSESSRLFKAGQNKQKLSEALMYGMAALPSEQIKTITPDYGRGDDAMSRMGLSTEPIRQEMMQGVNKALELTRSQVGTAGQLQSRGQSIMSNLSSQLSQSQIQQQQYLNQLRGALAQREDTKANVLAQSELTAREAKSAERAAKLDQLNNAISQTSAISAGTMEQASKMSTIENENERFKRNQDFIRELANQGVSFEVDDKGKIVFNNKVGSSNIKQADLSKQPVANNAANNGTGTIPASNAVVPAATTGTTHTIKKGDTLYAIAKANNTTVSNLVKLNGFKNDKALILPGQTIKIK